VRGIVKEVKPQKLILDDGTEVPYGPLVWSTGVGPSSFVRSLDFPKDPGGRYVSSNVTTESLFCFFPSKKTFSDLGSLCFDRIGIDEWMRVPSVQDVFAIGDCSGYLESTGKSTLPALAQVSNVVKESIYFFSILGVLTYKSL